MRKLKNILGLSIAGGLKKYISRYQTRYNVFDAGRVNCRVTEWKYPTKCFRYLALCYCNDSFAASGDSNWLVIYESKKYKTRQEAEAALDLDIIDASRIYSDSAFYRERYYPEHEAVGEPLCCKNGGGLLKKTSLFASAQDALLLTLNFLKIKYVSNAVKSLRKHITKVRSCINVATNYPV